MNASTQPHLTLPPLSLYIHVPWCVRKCPYCDFNSHARRGELPEADYVAALLEDLREELPGVQDRPLRSIFIGGGTPSLFSAASYARLLDELSGLLAFAGDIEITLEANPGTFEQDKFRDFRAAGINRLSIGIQSFDDDFLRRLGRIHDGGEARRAAAIARRAGFDNFNLDLMFALPGQDAAAALADLRAAVDQEPTHISWYQLTLEPNTEFYRFPPALPGDDAAAEMQEAGQALLESAGFARYEISAFARQGRESVHNLNYWRFGDYLGIGAGAHGKLTLPGEGRIQRSRKTRQPEHYLDANRRFRAAAEDVPRAELPLEFMMNAMRLPRGADRRLFEERTGIAFNEIAAGLDRLERRGLMERDGDAFRPSEKGLLFLNDLLEEFYPPDDDPERS